jgi:ribosomal protein S1
MDKWEGTVTDVDDEFFTVRLVPHGDGTEVIADFPCDLIADDDLRIGDVVYVTVRTIQSIGGPKRTSAVRLRRLGRWTQAEIEAQKARAKARHSRLQSKFA